MTEFLFLIFVVQCVAITVWAALKRERLIQFPFLATAVFMGWILPQLLGLRNGSTLPDGALTKLLLMSILCVAACFFGYVTNKKTAKMIFWPMSSNKLLAGSMLLSLFGAYFFFKVNDLAAEAYETTGGSWTGIITIYAFLSRAIAVGLVIAVVQFFQRKSWISISIIIFDLLFYFDSIFLKGRRANMVELFLIIMFAFWFNRRWAPKRWVFFSSLVVGTLLINGIADYRGTMLGADRVTATGAGYREIMKIDFLGNLENIASGDGASDELLNAALKIEAADQWLLFDYGSEFWNALVFRYLPGQWVGSDVKSALMFEKNDTAYRLFGHVAVPGTTSTGMADAFESFWYFGAINFFLIGLILSRWYNSAMVGNTNAQMIIMLTMTAALHSITQHISCIGIQQARKILLFNESIRSEKKFIG